MKKMTLAAALALAALTGHFTNPGVILAATDPTSKSAETMPKTPAPESDRAFFERAVAVSRQLAALCKSEGNSAAKRVDVKEDRTQELDLPTGE